MIVSVLFFTCIAIATDTAFYHGPESTTSFPALFKTLLIDPVFAPWNSIRYNSQTSNLALHGLHPRHQHFLVNLPQLLGPALIILLTSLHPISIRKLRLALSNPRFLSAVTGAGLLSIFPHQEPRFLLPCVPLLLTCIRLPTSTRGQRWFWTSWLTFNILLGTLMGIYHQGGVIPAQLQVPEQVKSFTSSSSVSSNITSATIFWWKTYPPPTYLLGNAAPLDISTIPLMGLSQPEMLYELSSALSFSCSTDLSITTTTTMETTEKSDLVFLIAPLSSHLFPASAFIRETSFLVAAPPLPPTISNESLELTSSNQQKQEGKQRRRGSAKEEGDNTLELSLTWSHRRHINLDDLDIGEDGLVPTLARVLGRRGLGMWRVRRICRP